MRSRLGLVSLEVADASQGARCSAGAHYFVPRCSGKSPHVPNIRACHDVLGVGESREARRFRNATACDRIVDTASPSLRTLEKPAGGQDVSPSSTTLLRSGAMIGYICTRRRHLNWAQQFAITVHNGEWAFCHDATAGGTHRWVATGGIPLADIQRSTLAWDLASD